jgi:proline iminopeptidase
MSANLQAAPREGYLPVENAELYYRDIGAGQPIILLHGGPDFDHSYFLPEMDYLSVSYRLIYYAQRGRGKSAGSVQPEDVSLASELEDLWRLSDYFELNTAAVLGHSWGGLLALEYALRHRERVSHLILMDTAPISHDDYRLLHQERRRQSPDDLDRLNALAPTAKYAEGDFETEAEYYRIHFGATLRPPELLEKLIKSLRLNFTRDSLLKARAIENRLMDETWLSGDYDVLPKLQRLDIPTLIIYGDYDFIPMECSAHIAQAIPGARLAVLKGCGHFTFLECPDQVRREISDFFRGA